MISGQVFPPTAISATRYEFKAVTEGCLLPDARMWLRLHPACFRMPYPPRQVNSLYFDTMGLDSFGENLAGASARHKARLRWYGASSRQAQCVFEVKCKRNRLGWKLSQRVQQPVDIPDMTWAKLMALLEAELSPQLGLFLADGQAPVVLLRYQREYYQTFDGAVRVTLDYGLAAYDQREYIRLNLCFAAPLADELVIEFKGCSTECDALSAVIDSVPFRLSARSKYAEGIGTLLGY
jgi:hypothetical protein